MPAQPPYRPRLHLDAANPEHQVAIQFIEQFGTKVVNAFLLNQLVRVSRKCLTEGINFRDLDVDLRPAGGSSQSEL